MNPLKDLQKYGQSVWLDYIRRSLITSGELQHMVEEEWIRGVTSNPTIFQKAIAGSSDYDDDIKDLIKTDSHLEAHVTFEKLALKDIQLAADILRPIYDKTDGIDGDQTLFVHSDEVEAAWQNYSPLLEIDIPVHPYPAGTWGPTEADKL